MSSSYRLELDRWLSQLDVKANKVLDIGGSQLPVKGRTKSWDVHKYLIADLHEPQVGSPKPDIELDLNYLDPGYFEDDIDIIFCLEVFDYIWNPLRAFQTIETYLKPKGIAWVTFPAFYPTHNPIEDDSLNYKEGGIRKLAKASGLTINQMIRRRPETNALQQYFSAERLRAAKEYDHDFMGFIVEFTK